MVLKFDVYVPGKNAPPAAEALIRSLEGLDVDKSYANMMRLRASGGAAAICNDTYYLCTDEQNRLISRLWMGFGRHASAIGNWGNFFTEPDFRGQGVGKKLLDLWFDDIKNRADLPLALFCTSGSERLTEAYAKYGFRTVIEGAKCGPLYCPLGDSPETFMEFCKGYYKPANSLIFKPATLEWRHEIDCLFKFIMLYAGLDYLPHGVESLEKAILDGERGVKIIFTDAGTPVGVCKSTPEGDDVRIHPSYLHMI